jgi:perosamine synthetase
MAAAIGLSQLDALDAVLARRRAIAERYRSGLASSGLAMQAMPPGATRNEQTFGVLAESAERRDALIAGLVARKIEAGKLSYALGRLPSFASAERASDPTVSTSIADRGLALPLYAALSDADVDRVIAALREVRA